MITLSHPFGNQNVRQALKALRDAEMLDRFHTTVFWDSNWAVNTLLPTAVRSELGRRCYPQLRPSQICSTPLREVGRLLFGRLGIAPDVFSTEEISKGVDLATARCIQRRRPAAVYAYAGTALESFRAARLQGTKAICELPSGYWRYTKRLFQEESVLRPEYAGTITGYNYASSFLDERDEELELASEIIIPSTQVGRTLAGSPVGARTFHTIPYGSPASTKVATRMPGGPTAKKLRVLFVGYLTQVKGFSYLIDAVRLMGPAVQLTIIGRKVGHCTSVDKAVARNRWLPSVSNQRVLEEMATSDVLVLPSLSEGFGLVIGEALSRGLPVVTTDSTGGAEVIREGKDGFIVPIRSAEAIAEKLEVLYHDRERLNWMSISALQRAREFTWRRYRDRLIQVLNTALQS